MLDCLAQLGPDADRRAANFLELHCPWMTPAERTAAKETAFRSKRFWSASALGDELDVTEAERETLGIRTFRAAGVSDHQMAAIQKEKRQRREQDRRLRERMSRKPKASQPARRADAILALLPPDGWWDAGAIVKELRRSKAIAFASLDGDAFRPAVHRAIKHGVTAGMFQTRTASGPKMEKVQIRRAVSR
jgi:hypothetical protein